MSTNKKFGLAGVMGWPVGFVALTADERASGGGEWQPLRLGGYPPPAKHKTGWTTTSRRSPAT
jgi:hypothetical protein